MLGLSVAEFETVTLRQIDAIYKGYERREQVAWYQARYIAQYSLLPHLKQRDFRKITKGMRFEFEDEPPRPEFKGDVKSILEKWDNNPPKK